MFSEYFEDMGHHLSMMFNHLGKDQDVVHVDHYRPLVYEAFENVIHHSLECHQTVSETEKHDQRLEESMIHAKGCFPLITLSDPHIIVSPSHVQFHEVLGFCIPNLVDNVWHEGSG